MSVDLWKLCIRDVAWIHKLETTCRWYEFEVHHARRQPSPPPASSEQIDCFFIVMTLSCSPFLSTKQNIRGETTAPAMFEENPLLCGLPDEWLQPLIIPFSTTTSHQGWNDEWLHMVGKGILFFSVWWSYWS